MFDALKAEKSFARNGVVYGVYLKNEMAWVGSKFVPLNTLSEEDRKFLIKNPPGFYIKYKSQNGAMIYESVKQKLITFTDEQMDRIPDDKRLYQDSGYDAEGYYQAGFLYGTLEELEGCEMEHSLKDALVWRMKDYVDKYGKEYVEEIIGKTLVGF